MLVPFHSIMLPLVEVTDFFGTDTIFNMWIVYLGFGTPLSCFFFHGFIKGIPLELEQAAMIDGCRPGHTYFLVIVPLLKPSIATVAVMNAMWVWNDFLMPKLVLSGYQTLPIAAQIFNGGIYGVQINLMMTAILPHDGSDSRVFTPTLNGFIITGITSGAIK